MNISPIFSGSYRLGDVEFLLKPVTVEFTSVEEKEALIQSGQKHYSDMLSQEPEPTQYHLELFNKAYTIGAERLANEVMMLAVALANEYEDTPIVLTSLVRAGVPLGVMLQRALTMMGKESYHYGISIIRDRGLDEQALSVIEDRHGTQGIVWVDGWTGKGAITHELTKALRGRCGYPTQPRLVVLADPCGCAWLSATDDDWLIPFGIMGAPVSGMISRSLYSDEGYHQCMVCNHLSEYECGLALVDAVEKFCLEINPHNVPVIDANAQQTLKTLEWKQSKAVISKLVDRYDVSSTNRIKPGIAEATRAVLRRVPDQVLVRSIEDPDVSLLVYLAKEKGVEITEVGDLIGQYRAVTIIKQVL
ncbi:cysteine protease StiP family protein [Marinomonas fungiae]|uniref:PELOTA RNA binding domain/Phosphoribosyl transferase (PRTase) n=1 Tax=Marinomonas fungiae TaxID=1137284 RepID=A0A0K6IU77_9GAMM|nr:cysteine protease StiP family protein [Marinomonas fungiae]CUB06666.1 PELOTA RNA binding domain/Phosphoribosyl transferase (PRTase) [Marinomonas fungiae]